MSRRQPAFTMTEVVVVVAMSGIVLLTGLSLVHMVLGVERKTQKSLQLSTSGSKLSRVFRQDMHSATRLEPVAPDDTSDQPLRLGLPDDRIVTYQVHSHRLARIGTVNGEVRHQDEFIFPAGSQIELQISDDSKRVAISVGRPDNTAERKTRTASDSSPANTGLILRIEATIGRDVRFAPIPELES